MSYNDSSLVKGGFEVALTLTGSCQAAIFHCWVCTIGLQAYREVGDGGMEMGQVKKHMKLTVLTEVQPNFLNNFTILLATFVWFPEFWKSCFWPFFARFLLLLWKRVFRDSYSYFFAGDWLFCLLIHFNSRISFTSTPSLFLKYLFWNNLRLTRSCKSSTESSHVPLTQLPPVITSYITLVHFQNEKIGIATILLT